MPSPAVQESARSTHDLSPEESRSLGCRVVDLIASNYSGIDESNCGIGDRELKIANWKSRKNRGPGREREAGGRGLEA